MKTKQRKIGFTIVELLTVMAVIAMLMGILVPALNLVRKLAKDVNQKAEFHSIDVALAAYINESPTQQYPDSFQSGTKAAGQITVGAQKLAEALLGRDLVGFDPNSTWNAYADSQTPAITYTYAKTDPQKTASLERRQGPYLDPGNAEVFQVGNGQLFANTYNVYPGSPQPAPVLTDVYRVKNVVSRGKTVMAGTPILYYKANTSVTKFPDTNDPLVITIPDPNLNPYIYNSIDNEELIACGQLKNPNAFHNFDYINRASFPKPDGSHDGRWWFYKAITDRKITTQSRPYNMTSYILVSAGADGIYGTKDDIYNFQ
ncbi:MAG: type II secretion system protein [Sedimentisphaerales bacterium]